MHRRSGCRLSSINFRKVLDALRVALELDSLRDSHMQVWGQQDLLVGAVIIAIIITDEP